MSETLPIVALQVAEVCPTPLDSSMITESEGVCGLVPPSTPVAGRAGSPLPVWAKRTYSALAPGDVAAMARNPQFAMRMMQLLVRLFAEGDHHAHAVDSSAGGSTAVSVDNPGGGSSAASVNTQICREALQLLIGCVLSTPAALTAFCEESTLLAWMRSMLLHCPDVEARLEVVCALFMLSTRRAQDDTAGTSDLKLSIDHDLVRGALIRCLIKLLLEVEQHNARCRQFFELLHALVSADLALPETNKSSFRNETEAQDLCKQMVEMTNLHGVQERRDCPEAVDQGERLAPIGSVPTLTIPMTTTLILTTLMLTTLMWYSPWISQ